MNNNLIILKFGGTSVSTLEKWQIIEEIAKSKIKQNLKPVLVCSALSQISNLLEKAIYNAENSLDYALEYDLFVDKHSQLLASGLENYFFKLSNWLHGIKLLGECSPKTRAQVLSLGELCSTFIGKQLLAKTLSIELLDARELLKSKSYLTSSSSKHYLQNQSSQKFNKSLEEKLLKSKHQAIITQGFIGSDDNNNTVLFGRGGSDTSAAYLAAQSGAKLCEIWTDVPGLFTANPRQIPSARLIKQLSYKEAQEIAINGAKVLHPACIPPLNKNSIELFIKDTNHPDFLGTKISSQKSLNQPGIKAIATKQPTQIISIETIDMWNEVGFLANFFQIFKTFNFSVDLISTSETSITVTVNRNFKKSKDNSDDLNFNLLCDNLRQFGKVTHNNACASISLIGSGIRSILPQIASALSVFEEFPIYLMTQAANDLSLTFVVNDEQAEKIARQIHGILFSESLSSQVFGDAWQNAQKINSPNKINQNKIKKLLDISQQTSPAYVYDLDILQNQITKLDQLKKSKNLNKIFYAIKANPNLEILKVLDKNSFGFECVSQQELEFIFKNFPKTKLKNNILFTPNFAEKSEYEYAFSQNTFVTLDSIEPIKYWPEIFENQEVLLRLDPGKGKGHHKHVMTAGKQSKFGISLDDEKDLEELINIAKKINLKIIGLHAHAGSGISDPDHWLNLGLFLNQIKAKFEKKYPSNFAIKHFNLGGGLGVPYKPSESELDFTAFDKNLSELKKLVPNTELWLEPGRFIAAECGILLARVNQIKSKSDINYIGLNTGMNSLLRPALYGSYHEIRNLSKIEKPNKIIANIVGPICETGDILGYSRSMPKTEIGDIIMISNAGAYGKVMASNYNLRPSAEEIIL